MTPPPKYLNSSDSLIFQKGKNLYGFYQGSKAIRQSEEALLLEGYMDVIAAHQAHVENAVAPLGTSLTIEQCRILKRYASNVTVLFDMDKAGETASIRGAELLLEHGFFPMMARLPGAKDVDEYLKKNSPEALKAVLAKKITLVDFRIDVLLKEKENLPPQVRRTSAAEAALPLAMKTEDEIVRSEILKNISSKTGVPLGSLNIQWRKLAGRKGSFKAQEIIPLRTREILNSEEELFCLALEYAQLRPGLLSLKKELELFCSFPLKEGFETLCRSEMSSKTAQVIELIDSLNPEAAGVFRGLVLKFEKVKIENPEAIFEDIAGRLKKQKKEERLKDLGREASKIPNEGVKDSPTLEEFRKLAKIVKGKP
jgi:DNA primase